MNCEKCNAPVKYLPDHFAGYRYDDSESTRECLSLFAMMSKKLVAEVDHLRGVNHGDNAIAIIEGLETDKKNLADGLERLRWIPIDEDLPKELDEPVPYRSKIVEVANSSEMSQAEWWTRRKVWAWYGSIIEPITHWRYRILPETERKDGTRKS